MRPCGSFRFRALAVLVLTSAELSVPYAAMRTAIGRRRSSTRGSSPPRSGTPTVRPRDRAEDEETSTAEVAEEVGNYGSGTGFSGVPYAPANDPFVITVGATDPA